MHVGLYTLLYQLTKDMQAAWHTLLSDGCRKSYPSSAALGRSVGSNEKMAKVKVKMHGIVCFFTRR